MDLNVGMKFFSNTGGVLTIHNISSKFLEDKVLVHYEYEDFAYTFNANYDEFVRRVGADLYAKI